MASLQELYEKMAGMEIPAGVDDQEREGQQLPTKTWFLGQFPPAGRGDSAGLDIGEGKDGTKFYNLKFALHPVGAEPKTAQKDGPFTPLFAKVNPHGWNDEKKAFDSNILSPRLMGLMNSVLSTEFPHNSPERWQNTLGTLFTKANELGADPGQYASEACFLAAMFGEILNATQPRLMFKVSARKAEKDGKPVLNAAGEKMYNYNLGDFADATPAGISEKKIVEWTKS